MECSKKEKCKNYREKCDACMSLSDIYNHYPWFKSVDVVEVVRCKDCKSSKDTIEPNVVLCKKLNRHMRAFDFCSYGERRTPDA